MKHTLVGVLLSAILVFAGSAHAYEFNFGTVPGSQIVFDPVADTFQFTPVAGGHSLVVTDSMDVPSLVGYQGDITGTFKIGSVVTVAGSQTATVTPVGPAYFTLYKPGNESIYLTAQLNWDLIGTTPPMSFGTFGGIGGPDWTDATLVGYDAALAQIAGPGNVNVSFQFNPSKQLSDLVSGTAKYGTSFSGSVQAVPEPSTLAGLVGVGLAGVLMVVRRIRK
jgi:hypothetical protein